MKMRILSVVFLMATLAVTSMANANEKVKVHFKPLYEKFGQNSTTTVKVVSGPVDVKMRNGRVAGKCWIATSGDYRFKLTIEDSTMSAT